LNDASFEEFMNDYPLLSIRKEHHEYKTGSELETLFDD
jgi:hypothetical protein